MSTQSIRNICDMMERAIKFIQKEIRAKERRTQSLTERLEKLQCKENSDAVQIEEITADIQDLQGQLENDRAQLSAFQEEFTASCGQ